MNGRPLLILPDGILDFSFGDSHPFDIRRFSLFLELADAYGLIGEGELVTRVPDPPVSLLEAVHEPEYLRRLRLFSEDPAGRADFRYGLGDVENPVFAGMYEWSVRSTAATLHGARLVADGVTPVAFNPAGGWHHAHRARASGFSYINDAAVAITELVQRGVRVAYLDLDAHHGDGVQEAFYDTDRVLTVSIHESGIYFFPGTGFVNETGVGSGEGYSVNVPLRAHTDDPLYMKAFDEVAYPLIAAFDPDVLVTQIGADTFRTDPLTNLEITTHSYSYVMRKLKALKIPWLALGGGGYDIVNVARAWTIAWGVMTGAPLDPRLPEPFVRRLREMGKPHTMLLDAMHWALDDDRYRALDDLDAVIRTIRRTIFPRLIGPHDTDSR